MNRIGDIIRDFRLKNNKTRLDIERDTKINQSVLWKIETGVTKKPEYKTIRSVAIYLKIPYSEVLNCFEEETRIYVLSDLLDDAIIFNDKVSVIKVSQLILRSVQVSIENRLNFLLSKVATVKEQEIALTLYELLLKQARANEMNRLVAKIKLEKYLIERNNFSKLRETYSNGCKLLDYITFLDQTERTTFYYKIGVHAYNLGFYEDCINFCTKSIEKDNTPGEMKAGAVFAICNSYIFIGQYDLADHFLEVYKKYPLVNVFGKTMLTSGTIDARRGLYDSAINKFNECLKLKDTDITLHAVNELLRIYLKVRRYDLIPPLLDLENEMFNYTFITPRKAAEKANYFRLKAEYLIEIGLFEKGVINYIDSALLYGKVSDYCSSFESLEKLSMSYVKKGKQMEIDILKKLNEVYNELYKLSGHKEEVKYG